MHKHLVFMNIKKYLEGLTFSFIVLTKNRDKKKEFNIQFLGEAGYMIHVDIIWNEMLTS